MQDGFTSQTSGTKNKQVTNTYRFGYLLFDLEGEIQGQMSRHQLISIIVHLNECTLTYEGGGGGGGMLSG